MRFSESERESYARDGFVLRRAVLRPDELERLRANIEEVVAALTRHAGRPGAGPEIRIADGHRLQFSSRSGIQWEWREGSSEIRLAEPFAHLHPGFQALLRDPRLVDPCRDALGVAPPSPTSST